MSDSPIISFAANLIGGVVGASMQDPVAGATTSAFVASAIENVPTLLQRGRSAADAEGMKALHERIEELQEKMRELQDATKGAAPTATHVSATLQAYLDAWASSHDNRVREYARNAAVKAFDPRATRR